MTQYEADGGAGNVLDRTLRELAEATAVLVEEHDIVGTVTHLLAGAARAVGADAAGLLLRNDRSGRLELLASTTHRAAELELYQLHGDLGPCIDASRTGHSVSVYGADDIASAWPDLADVFARNRFSGVHATPLRWHGRELGAVGLFFVTAPAAAQQQPVDDAARAFAAIATLAVLHAGDVSMDRLLVQTRAALAERTIIEQAKGVLAYTDNLGMDAAFDRLVALAAAQRQPITRIAAQVVTAAATR
ncbi:ANTAR domain-containing protein [Kribbella sp. NPDC056951]|uniref:ANTAR domain-containing protein n=1 Tax=Kribbella sp. NPDC056951 TaxID=3345978 RepID=UPI003642B9BD